MVGIRQFDEEAIFEKAMDLFWNKGFSETSLQELAAVTGIRRGSLYNAYQSKEAFFLRVFEVHKNSLLAQMRIALDQPKLRDSIQSYFNFIIDSMTIGEPARGCLSTKVALGSGVLDAPIREALQNMLDEIEQLFKTRLSRSEDQADLRVPANEAALLLLTFTRGLVVIERVYQDKVKLNMTAQLFINLLFGNATDQDTHQ